jgi:hypothetical protein
MKTELKVQDLANMVQGVSPNYHLFENELVKRCGSYNGSYGTWSWKEYELLKLSEEQLYGLYVLCRDSFKRRL